MAALTGKATGRAAERGSDPVAPLRIEQMTLTLTSPLPVVAILINAVFFAVSTRDHWPLGALLCWFALMAIATVFLRHCAAGLRTPAPATRLRAVAAATGTLWGMISLIVLVTDAFAYHAFAGFALAVTAAATVVMLATVPPALNAFLVPAIAPLALAFMLQGGADYIAMGAMVLCYGAIMAMLGQVFRRAISGTWRLQIENDVLAKQSARDCTKAGEASQAKLRFLAQMSHELRTPLNAIIGFSELLATETYGPLGDRRYEEYARHIHDSGNTLLSVIDRILNYTDTNVGALRLAEDAVDLSTMLHRCLASVSDQARSRGLSIQLELGDKLPALRGDPTMLRAIVFHLLTNAAKFSVEGGQITLSARQMADGGISLSVSDQGIGMNPEDIPEALVPFARLETRLKGGEAGLGLGLALTKILVELHDGSLAFDSVKNAGTTVTVTFPPERSLVRISELTGSSAPSGPPESAADGRRRRSA